MNTVIGESVQSMVLPGFTKDTVYAGVSNVVKERYPTKVQNKFYQSFNSTAQGSSSTVLFNPTQAVSDIFVELVLPDVSGVDIALNRGWGLIGSPCVC